MFSPKKFGGFADLQKWQTLKSSAVLESVSLGRLSLPPPPPISNPLPIGGFHENPKSVAYGGAFFSVFNGFPCIFHVI